MGVAALRSRLTIVENTAWPEGPQKVGQNLPTAISTQSTNIKAPSGQLKNAMVFAIFALTFATFALKNHLARPADRQNAVHRTCKDREPLNNAMPFAMSLASSRLSGSTNRCGSVRRCAEGLSCIQVGIAPSAPPCLCGSIPRDGNWSGLAFQVPLR